MPGEDLVIEEGSKVVVSIKGIHYDEEYWKNPKEFDPERFSEEKKKNMNQYTHLPFGQGPRVCIGMYLFMHMFFSETVLTQLKQSLELSFIYILNTN